jgi:regulator of sigma E protease
MSVLDLITDFRDVIVLVLFFSFTIFVHELGHFLVAIKLGFIVDTFSIGFGPAIVKRKIKGVIYKIGWLPLGGYVALPQLDPTAMDTIQGASDLNEEETKKLQEELQRHKDMPESPPWKKIMVLLAGATGNVIFAIALAFFIYLSPAAITGDVGPVTLSVDADSQAYEMGIRTGDEVVTVNGTSVDAWYKVTIEAMAKGPDASVSISVKSDDTVTDYELDLIQNEHGFASVPGLKELVPPFRIKEVREGDSADKAGIKSGDIPREFNGVVVKSAVHFIDMVKESEGNECSVLIERNGQLITMAVTPKYDAEEDRALIGVIMDFGGVLPWMHYRNPWDQVKADASMIFRVLKGLVTPSESKQMAKGIGGPIKIIQALWLSMQISYLNALGFLRMLNINLAIMNLLPIPLLDGGHIMFSLWEGITRRKIHPKVVNVLVNVFGILLIGLMLLITCKDVLDILPEKFRFMTKKDKPDLEAPAVPGADK